MKKLRYKLCQNVYNSSVFLYDIGYNSKQIKVICIEILRYKLWQNVYNASEFLYDKGYNSKQIKVQR